MSFHLLHHGNQGVAHSVSGPSAKASEEDQERTRRLADAEMHRHHLESLLDQRDREINALREVMSSPPMGDVTLHFVIVVIFTYIKRVRLHLSKGAASSLRGNP